jgi:hypothetical protein
MQNESQRPQAVHRHYSVGHDRPEARSDDRVR